MNNRLFSFKLFFLASPIWIGILSCGASISLLDVESKVTIISMTQVVEQTRMVTYVTTSIVTPTSPPSTIVQVFADQGWQDTHVKATPENKVTIRYISGEWTGGIGKGAWYDGRGDLTNKYKCVENYEPNQCDEPMPNVYNGTLVGKIGNSIFEVGNYIQFVPRETGNIFLRMNDHDEGLFDNEGYLNIEIIVFP